MYYTLVPFFYDNAEEFYALTPAEQVMGIADAFTDKLDDAADTLGITYKAAKEYGVHPLDDLEEWDRELSDRASGYASQMEDEANWKP